MGGSAAAIVVECVTGTVVGMAGGRERREGGGDEGGGKRAVSGGEEVGEEEERRETAERLVRTGGIAGLAFDRVVFAVVGEGLVAGGVAAFEVNGLVNRGGLEMRRVTVVVLVWVCMTHLGKSLGC